jgi:hypothetical protein
LVAYQKSSIQVLRNDSSHLEGVTIWCCEYFIVLIETL